MVRKASVPTRVVPKRKKKRSGIRKWIKVVFSLLLLGVSALVIFVGVLFTVKLGQANERVKNLAAVTDLRELAPTQIFSADGKLLYESGKFISHPVNLADVPKLVQDATLAAEDKRFHSHNGVDEWAVIRQMVTNFREQRIAGGASTLTMQLAKLSYTSSEKSIDRKVDDMAIALQLERRLTKDQILELYLNKAYYGSGAYGIVAAAEVYFNKKLDKLSIAEAAMLARCVRRPSDQNPFVNLEISTENRDAVLRVMRDEGMIKGSEYDAAKAEPTKLAALKNRNVTILRSGYFVRYILDEIRNLPQFRNIDVSEGGYRIETTLDTTLQDVSDKEAKELVNSYRRSGVRTAAFLLTNRDGGVLAMTGGIDFENRQYNAVTQGSRQPGSSFKPFVYGVAFDRGDLTPSSSISNASIREVVGGKLWEVQGNGATMSVRQAIAYSKNAAAVRALEIVGPDYFVGRARSVFGFRSDLPAVKSLVLGSTGVRPIEMAEAYSVFQTKGTRVKPYGIVRILTNQGEIKFAHTNGANVTRTDFSNQACWEVDSCLRDVVRYGTAAPSGVSAVENARGKTGTTNDNRDAWFCGYSNSYIGIGWVSGERLENDRWVYPPMSSYVMGGTVTGRMWRDIMRAAQRKLGESDDEGPGDYEYRPGRSYVEKSKREESADPIPVDVSEADAPSTRTNSAPVKPEDSTPRNDDPPTLPDGPSGLPDGPGATEPDY